jgi:hypothetical protein
MPSWTPIPAGKRQLAQHKRGGGIPPLTICLFASLLISQITKEVRYQELQACHCSTTVGCVRYIMNTKYAICKGKILLDRLVWINVYWLETPSPNPGSAVQCASTINWKTSCTWKKASSQLNLKKGGHLMQRCKSPPTFLLELSGWFLMRGLSCWILVWMYGMCLKFSHNNILFATFWLNSITCFLM